MPATSRSQSGSFGQPRSGRLDEPLGTFLWIQPADECYDTASHWHAQGREVGRLPSGKPVEIHAVGDNHKLVGRQPSLGPREIGHLPADADVPIHPTLR